jgi:hypothetical protein
VVEDDLEPYERRVEPATTPLADFRARLLRELDQRHGAFRWWSEFSDWKTLNMIADYLLQSLAGASEALLSASFAAQTHYQTVASYNEMLDAAWKRVAATGTKDPRAFIDAVPNDAASRTLRLQIAHSAEQCFFHLGQTLDRLAAALFIVGGFERRDVAGVYWTDITKSGGLLDELTRAKLYKHPQVEPPSTAGRAIQEALLAPIRQPDDFGEPGWLDWLRETRNAMTHRPPAVKFDLMRTDGGIVRLFYREPKWSELQALVFGPAQTGELLDTFILRPSEDVLDGLCDSTSKLIVALTDRMATCWDARKKRPSTIIQHGCQWPTVRPTPISTFDGYGEDLSQKVQADTIASNDVEGLRWSAARVTDDRRRDWHR